MKHFCVYILAAVLAAVATVPCVAGVGKRVVAVVLNSDLPRYVEARRAFLKELGQQGVDMGRVEILTQCPNPDPISWSNSIRKVTALGADVVVTFGAPVTLTAMRQCSDVSLVFADVYGPVETGISGIAQGGKTAACGISSKLPLVTLVRAAHDIKKFRTMGVLFNAHEIGSVVQLKEMKRLGAQMGFAVREVNVASAASLDSLLHGTLPQVDMLYVSEGTYICQRLDGIIEKSLAANVPVVSQVPESAERGALLSLEVDPGEQGQEAGRQVAGILNGKQRDRMPFRSPKKIHFVLNLRTARTLDLNVPFQVLSAVTRVIK